MEQARKGELNQFTYFPVSAHTPTTVLATLKNAGINISDKPLAMRQKKRVVLPENFVFFVALDSGKETVAVIEFDSFIDKEMIEMDGQGDEYHTTVTVFEPDRYRNRELFDYSEYLLSNRSNYELEIIKESPESETAIRQTQATASKAELSNPMLPQKSSSVNPQNTEIADAQNEKGLDREQEATFSLSRNAEYMDNAIAFNNKGGYAGTVPLVFAVRSIDQDVRSQIYSIATKKNPTIPRGDGTQGDPANAHPSYGDSSSSGDIVEQNATAVNPKIRQSPMRKTKRVWIMSKS